MSKYTIKNCPCYDYDFEECLDTLSDEYKKCYDCTDCVLKQIVELAKGYKKKLIDKETKEVVATRYFKLTRKILDLLDIEEVE